MISLLLPTISIPLARRFIQAASHAGVDDYEIVVCSPERIEGHKVVWVPDTKMAGNNPAHRMAFEKCTGNIVISVQDGITLIEGWAVKCIAWMESDPGALWGLATPAGRCAVFGRYYPFYPMAHRDLIKRHWKYFFPYQAHWGDPALALDVRRTGGRVKETPEYIVVEHADRLGQPESHHKAECFVSDMNRFLEDFKDLSAGWDLSDWRNFNRQIP